MCVCVCAFVCVSKEDGGSLGKNRERPPPPFTRSGSHEEEKESGERGRFFVSSFGSPVAGGGQRYYSACSDRRQVTGMVVTLRLSDVFGGSQSNEPTLPPHTHSSRA